MTFSGHPTSSRLHHTRRGIFELSLLFAAWVAACQSHAPATHASHPAAAQSSVGGVAGTSQSDRAHSAQAGREPLAATPRNEPAVEANSAEARCKNASLAARNTSGVGCGALDCRAFEQAEDALAYVVRETSPLVLGVGEIHAQKDVALDKSPTWHFAQLLPLFCPSARHIVIELWTSRNDCGDRRVEEVKQAQRPVTRAQAASNQNEFYELGNVAKANGIQPHALTPSCEDFASILAAKGDDIARMLELTASRSAELAEDLVQRKRDPNGVPFVILYGGAMHNDVNPSSGREAFSYGPRLAQSTKDRYTELDLVLREQLKDNETYRRFPWYAHVRGESRDDRYLLYRLGPRSFTLVFPAATKLGAKPQ